MNPRGTVSVGSSVSAVLIGTPLPLRTWHPSQVLLWKVAAADAASKDAANLLAGNFGLLVGGRVCAYIACVRYSSCHSVFPLIPSANSCGSDSIWLVMSNVWKN